MAKKSDLRNLREGTVINYISKRQEKTLEISVSEVVKTLRCEFPGVKFDLVSQLYIKDIIDNLSKSFRDVDFKYYHERSSMRPDGGILSIVDKSDNKYPILISEKKNQGTNDLRALEGKKKQAKGNAIERLGKNVIGFRAAMLNESIFPFICFGDGCDFHESSTIIDRVVTIAMFGHLNKVYLHNSPCNRFNRGSYFFKVEEWTKNEMFDICLDIARSSVYYYYSKYGESAFK